ncbi:MAG: hypothetical protein LBT47_09080, partial [Deltaproteobacteria bacterium]|nr:hypothetical protein [Deltaproteobacteria bacterium]
LWGLMLVHFALRELMAESAWQVKLDPDRLSFKGALYVIRRKLPQAAAFPPQRRKRYLLISLKRK